MTKLRLALCQINPTVGDISGNTDKIIQRMQDMEAFGPDIIAFPELAVTGYPPEDLLYKPHFIQDNVRAIEKISTAVKEPIVIVGFVSKREHLYNSAALLHKGAIVDIYNKIHLPNYGVFDEVRYFSPGNRYSTYSAGNIKFAINICEDIWADDGPAAIQAAAGAGLIININASPYHAGKPEERFRMLSSRAKDNKIAIAYLNMTGGQDELVFDGHSIVIDNHGALIAEGKRFEEDDIIIDIPVDEAPSRNLSGKASCGQKVEHVVVYDALNMGNRKKLPEVDCVAPGLKSDISSSDNEDIYKALVLGTRDYVLKNGFSKVCIGMSGGIDSSLVAVLAVDALGRDNVIGIFMPSPYTSIESRDDAYGLAGNLGMKLLEEPISSVFDCYLQTLKHEFEKLPSGIAEENLQARIRGNMLMGFSNKFGWLVLTTGNKSEMSVGYATLYGDMAGGFAPIKDVPKTLVYKLCEWRNTLPPSPPFPERVLTKAPTAELKPGQKDTDSLPPYEVLDPILKAYIEDFKGYEEIVSLGFDRECVRKAITMVDHSEYKRRQGPPGIKITAMAFGRDRRFPITNKYRSC